MATRIPTASQNAACDAIVDRLDGGPAAATIKIYTGAQPADPNSAASGTLLATLTTSDPAFGAASSGVATAGAIAAQNATANGTAGWFRAADSTGAAVTDGSVGITGSGENMELNSVALQSGLPVQITSWTMTMPAG